MTRISEKGASKTLISAKILKFGPISKKIANSGTKAKIMTQMLRNCPFSELFNGVLEIRI